MLSRRASVGVVALLLVGLTGCTGSPAPEPTPTPTGFASEEEAFAAAEETYRAYVEAINARNAGDESADPLRFLTGEIRQTEEELYRQSDEAGLRVKGELKITSLERGSVSLLAGAAAVNLHACMDSSNWKLINADGEDVTLDDVPNQYLTTVEMTTVGQHELVIHALVPDFESARC